jgi:hypothetical protein
MQVLDVRQPWFGAADCLAAPVDVGNGILAPLRRATAVA